MNAVQKYLAEIGRKGGQAKSAAKTASSRANARLPRSADRCPCGEMTGKRAKARGHRC